MSVAIIIATFGDMSWFDRGAHAARSCLGQGADEVMRVHHETLAMARNAGAERATAEWLCFLDADDELEPGYLTALLDADGDLRAPAIRYVQPDGHEPDPVVLTDRNIDVVNPCVIGTLVRRDMFLDVGGFWEERAWEDWSLFRRCWLAGASIVHVPDAVYRVNVNEAGRNSTVTRPNELHRQIVLSHRRWRNTREHA